MLSIEDLRDIRHGRGRFANLGSAGAFAFIAKAILAHEYGCPDFQALAEQNGPYAREIAAFVKAPVGAESLASWGTPASQDISNAYLTDIAPGNLVDAMKPHAYILPDNVHSLRVASGVVAEGVAEGAAKPLTPLDIMREVPERAKVAAILVMSKELARATGGDGDALFRKLLRDAVIRASNAALLAAIPTVPAMSGATPVDSLKVGLVAAADSDAYVVAAAPATVRTLALSSDGRMGTGGGEFIPGVTILPVELQGSGAPEMIVIPASAIAMKDSGLLVRTAGDATVEMQTAPVGDSTTPTSTTMVSLWQTGSVGILVERLVEVFSRVPAVEVG